MSCKKASELIDRRINNGLSIKERINLKFHVAMCDMCSVYNKQSKLIDEVIRARVEEIKHSGDKDVSSLVNRIQSHLKNEQ